MTMFYDPDIKGLCDQIRQLRDSILRRTATIGCEIDEISLPTAEAIVDNKIGAFLSSEDYHAIVAKHGNGPALRLLTGECAQAIFAAIPNKSTSQPVRGFWHKSRPDLHIVSERE